jgi:hypothetical protein
VTLYHHTFKGTHTGADPWNFGWYSQGAASLSAVQSAAVTWLANLFAGPGGTNGLVSLVTSVIASTSVTTTEVDPATGKQLTRADTTAAHAGTASGSSLPADVALCCTLRSATANRKGFGRFFLPSFAVSTVDTNGNVGATPLTTLTAALTFADAAFVSTSARTLYSRTDHLLRDVTSADVGNRWDTLRRRDDIGSEARTSWTPA